MTLGSYVLKGACIWTVGGLIGGAYLGGESNRAIKESRRLDNDCNYDCISVGLYGIFSGAMSIASVVYCPFVGMVAGASVYGVKKAVPMLRSLPKPVKIGAVAIPALLVATNAAYRLGNGE